MADMGNSQTTNEHEEEAVGQQEHDKSGEITCKRADIEAMYNVLKRAEFRLEGLQAKAMHVGYCSDSKLVSKLAKTKADSVKIQAGLVGILGAPVASELERILLKTSLGKATAHPGIGKSGKASDVPVKKPE